MRKEAILVSVSVISILFLSAIFQWNISEVKAGVPVPQGKIIFVGENFTDDAENHKWNSIQEGIDDAEERDTIYVFGGIYKENIFVDKNIDIVGKGDVTIDGMGALYTVNILSDGVKLSNLFITNGGAANLFLGGYSNVSIENCNFEGGNRYGAFLFETGHTVFKGCTFMSNVRGGLLIRNSSYIYILDSGVTISDWGIILENSSNDYIENVSILDIENKSVSIRESNYISIFDCNISDSFCGIRLRNSTYTSIDNCNLTNNIIGVRLDASSNNTVRRCNFDRNDGYGICISEFYGSSSTNNTIYRNFFFENANNAYDECSNFWNNSVGNYWDNYGGIDRNNDGIGDTPYHILGGDNRDYRPSILPFFSLPNFVWVNFNFNSSISGWQFDHFDNIQDGVDAVGESGTVYVFNGIYNETINIGKSLSLIGESNTSLFSVNDGIFVNSDGVSISGFSISAQGNGIKVQNAYKVSIYNCNVSQGIFGLYMVNSFGCSVGNSQFHDNMKGIYLFNSSGLKIYDSRIHNNSYFGMEISHGSSDNEISSCQIENNGNYGIYINQNSDGNKIYHNNFIGNSAYDVCSNDWGSTYENVLGNYWSDYTGIDSDRDGIGDIPYAINGGRMDENPLINPIAYPPAFVWVSPSFDSSFPSWGVDHFTSIGMAVGIVKDGGDCFVFPGVYNENIVLDKEITLSGAGNSSIVDGAGLSAITVTGSNVEIQNLGIRNCWNDAGLSILGNYARIFDCNVYDNYYGIQIHASYADVEMCSIRDNSFTGLMADNMQHSKINNCSVYENNNGVMFSYSSSNIIKNSNISSNSVYGIKLQYSSNNNTIYYTSFGDNIYGFYVNQSLGNYIYLNDFNFNRINAYDNGTDNWNDSIGNYWSDYAVEDNNFDGIGDSPYSIPGGINVDSYPLVRPAGLPVAYFTYIPYGGINTSTEITFVDMSVDLDGRIVSWTWDFGDGNISHLQNLSHRYGDNGTYNVTLEVTDDDGNTGNISHEVYVANIPPVVNFSWVPPDPTDVDIILFTDNSSDSDGIVVNWTWDFGDGVTAYGSSVMHTYAGNGTYNVTLTAVDDDDDSSSLQREVVVYNEPPAANFSYLPVSPSTSDKIQFSDLSIDADGTVVNRTWNFGDGNASYGQNASHRYTDNGTYAVTLTVKDNNNGTSNITKYVNVSNVAPVAGFSYIPSSPRDIDVIHFSDESYDTDGSVVSWKWDFGDGYNSTLQNPTHTYSDDGTYKVNLIVTDDDGSSSMFSDILEVRNAPPTADFYYSPSSPNDLENISFYDSSGDADGNIVSYSWDFGDGNTSTEKNPSHAYADNGIFTVKLIVTDDDGATDPVLYSVLVANVPPVADFSYAPENATDIDKITFTDNSTDADGTVVNRTWDFGDGNISYERNATHKYGNDGTYDFTLTVKDNDGAKSSKTDKLEVHNVKPVAKFTYTPQTPQEGKYVSFEDSSTDADGKIVNATWNFGDGTVEKDGTIHTHKYAKKGNYDVTLTITDDDGATSSIMHTVVVKGKSETSGFDFLMLVAAMGILLFMWRNKKGIWRMR